MAALLAVVLAEGLVVPVAPPVAEDAGAEEVIVVV